MVQQPSLGEIRIVQAHAADVAAVMEILDEAAAWLAARGIVQRPSPRVLMKCTRRSGKGNNEVLRPMRPEDIARQHEFNQDLELYGLDSAYPRVSPLERAHAFYATRTTLDENMAPFAIEADGAYIGYCSLMDLQNRYGNLELGILIGDRAYWGRGYGRAVIKLLLDYGFHYLGTRRIALTTHARNERAIRCYLACGFVEEGRPRKAVWIEDEYVDLVEMSILREEWQATPDQVGV